VRFSRISFAALSLSLGATGCAGLLGLDDFTEGETSGQAGTESTSSTEAGPGPGPGSGGAGTGTPTSSSTESGNGGGGSSGVGGEGGQGGSTGPLDVTPGEPKVGVLRGLQFEANQDVTWSVEEAEGGTIDEAGFYVSPAEPGDGPFHVIATAVADDSVTQTIEVTVVGLNAVVVGGIPGGPGNIDGTARRAHFDDPSGMGGFEDEQIFIADTRNHTIRRWDRDDDEVTTFAGTAGESGFADGAGADALFRSPTSLVVGNRIWVIDSENDCIRAIVKNTGVVSTLAGECGTTGSVDGLNGASSRFDRPEQMVLSEDGSTLYVCQNGGTRSIRAVNTTTGRTDTIISGLSSGRCALATDHWRGRIYYFDYDGAYVVKRFDDPFSAASVFTQFTLPGYIDGLAALTGFGNEDDIFFAYTEYVDDQQFSKIGRYNIGDDEVLPDPWLGDEEAYVDGDLGEARLTGVIGMTSDPSRGMIYFSDRASTIRSASWYEEEVETLLGPAPNIAPVDGSKAVARIPTPIGITLDGQGFAYETNFGNSDNTIRKIDLATGAISTFAGTRGSLDDENIVDGPPGTGTFGIATDIVWVEGQLYVTDWFSNTVRRVDGTSGNITTIAGELNSSGFADGVGAAARFNLSDADFIGGGLATDGVDLFVADTGNFAIRKVDVSSGTVTTIAGGTEGSADGTGEGAQFRGPSGMAFLDGKLYVADVFDSTIRVVDVETGEVTTLAGRAGEMGEIDGGPGVATFTTPFRVVADGIGNIYVSEVQGNVIRRIELDGAMTTTFLGTTGQRGVNPAPFPTTLNCPAGLAITGRGGDLIFTDACDAVVMQARPL
jgi:hypothetical protein